MRRAPLLLCALAGLFGILIGGAAAAVELPDRPIHIVVPYPPGGATDVLARLVAPGLGERLGRAVVVDNRTGANGVIGVQAVVHAPPDGTTLLMGTIATAGIQPTLLKDLPYDPERDLMPLVQVASQAYVVVVHPAFPAHSLAELAAAAARSPGGLQYASAGSGTAGHLFAAYWGGLAGIPLTPVHYRGAAPAMNDVIAGQLPMTFDVLLTTLQYIKGNLVRALAVTSAARSPQLPDVPTVAEQGFAGYDAVGWNGLFLPAHTPPEIVDRLSREINAVLSQPETRARVASQGAVVIGGSPAQFASFIHGEVAKWAKVIHEQHITPE